jgi:catechol 2,3-dioxygenase-like lactoylglutathione lyase family enzyme
MLNGITGAHWLIYSKNPEADRVFFRDVLGLRAVDAGGGWLIFAMPPSEVGVHPGDGGFVQRHAEHALSGAVLNLMCDDVRAEEESLHARGVRCAPVADAEWGHYTILQLPSGGEVGLYQPSHPQAINR